MSEVQPGLPWTFTPCQKHVKVRPGQSTLVFYNATNNSDEDMTGVSTYNVAPPQVRPTTLKLGQRKAQFAFIVGPSSHYV
jgi:cytochrome c oxidase assembly protein Cox11